MEKQGASSYKNKISFTEEEAAVYDRQIRLWGVESQKRLRKAKVLLIGLGSLGNEICKNIVLSGVDHMTIMDHRVLSKDDAAFQFLAPGSMIGSLRVDASYEGAKALNPMVDLKTDTDEVHKKPDEFFTNFDVVCMTNCSFSDQTRVNEICRSSNIRFFSSDCFANYGFSFADLGKHKFTEALKKIKTGHIDASKENEEPPVKKSKEIDADDEEIVEKVIDFVSLEDATCNSVFKGMSEKQISKISKSYLVARVMWKFFDKHGRYPTIQSKTSDWEEMLQLRDEITESLGVGSEMLDDSFVSFSLGSLYPVCCIVGGVLSQEIIKCVSGSGKPHNNFFLYDGTCDGGTIECIKSR